MSLDSVGLSSTNKMPGSMMTHSLSTPSGVDDITSALNSAGGKKLAIRIQMLDDSVTMFQVQVKSNNNNNTVLPILMKLLCHKSEKYLKKIRI